MGISKDRTKIVKDLINAGAELDATLDARDKTGRTPLHEASIKGNTAVVQLLIEKGADVKAIDNNGNTPLHEAAANGNTQMAQLLIEKGANVKAINKKCFAPLHKAVFYRNKHKNQEVINLLYSLHFPNLNQPK